MDSEDIAYLNTPWRIKIDTEKATQDIPLVSVPRDFYRYIEPDGTIDLEKLEELVKLDDYEIDYPINSAKVTKNIHYNIIRDFFSTEPDLFYSQEMAKSYKNKIIWSGMLEHEPLTKCRQCKEALYKNLEHYVKTNTRYFICQKCIALQTE